MPAAHIYKCFPYFRWPHFPNKKKRLPTALAECFLKELTADIQTRRQKKKKNYFRFFHIFLFHFLNTQYYPINYIIELAQLKNKLHIPDKDKFDISVQLQVMLRTNI